MSHHDGNEGRVRISVHGTEPCIELDGRQLGRGVVGAYTVSQVAGEPAHVVVHPADPAEVCFSGCARVSVADASAPGPAAAVFLAAIDAEELERTALTRLEMGDGPHSLTQAMLDQLQEWARGV